MSHRYLFSFLATFMSINPEILGVYLKFFSTINVYIIWTISYKFFLFHDKFTSIWFILVVLPHFGFS